MDAKIICGDALDAVRKMPSSSVDAVVTDPPYPGIARAYGTLTEDEWHGLVRPLVVELRRVLRPRGSAVLLIQPGFERIGRMRPWVWDFLAWAAREWGVIQDAYAWNYAAIPSAGAKEGFMRSSLKYSVWVGPPDCHRDQDAVLWEESQWTTQQRLAARAGRLQAGRRNMPSGQGRDKRKVYEKSAERGGVTPFNVLPMTNADPYRSKVAGRHPATTPYQWCHWWVRYICPPGGLVLDPFCGSGTVGVACRELGRGYVGVELDAGYAATARTRLGV